MMRYVKILSVFLVAVFSSGISARAQVTFADLPMPFTTVYTPGMSRTEMKICQIRRIFCGDLAAAIVAMSVFTIGIMILNNAISWGTAMFMIAGMAVFYYAEDIAFPLMASTALMVIANPICNCRCTLPEGFNFSAASVDELGEIIAEHCVNVGSGWFNF